MMSTAATNIFRRALALKPDGVDGALDNLDLEQAQFKKLANKLKKRRRYLQDLSAALNRAPKSIVKEPFSKMVQPLNETVGKVHSWLNAAQKGLIDLNKVVKHQNYLLGNAISEFARTNHNILPSNPSHLSKRRVNFVKA